jgi:uncharacterized protein (TIGR03435 family)
MRAVFAASLLISGVGGAAGVAFGQPAEPPPAFEVASVKPSPPAEAGMRIQPDAIAPSPGGVTMTNTSFKAAVQWAYHLQAIQVVGPGWIDSNRYDIVAKAPGAVSNEQIRKMMQTLLSQRFQFVFHRETKEMQAYVVTVAKSGHKMTPSQGEGEMQIKPTGKGLLVAFSHVTLAQFSEMASNPLQGVVVDQTGLTGAWDFTLDASSFAMSQPTNREDAIGMIIQVLYSQLGIKIDQKKVPAEILVVDRAEKVPVEN